MTTDYKIFDTYKNIVIYDKPKPVQELKFKDLNLQEVDLTNNKGNIMIINFWATWCLPCKREMPSLEKLSQNFPQIKVYPINMEKPNKLKARDFYKSIGVTGLDIYFDPEFDLVKKFIKGKVAEVGPGNGTFLKYYLPLANSIDLFEPSENFLINQSTCLDFWQSLVRIFKSFGDERDAKLIVKNILKERLLKEIDTPNLVRIIEK